MSSSRYLFPVKMIQINLASCTGDLEKKIIVRLKEKVMNEFLLIFRRSFAGDETPSPEQLQASIKPWQDWLGNIAAQDKLARPLQRWDAKGKVVTSNKTVINGPYAEIKESIGGLIIVKAQDYEEAVEIAKGCPVLQMGGNVEVRLAVPADYQG